ncbi:hypothetical protein METSCH_D06770 [Metschnikowia aff. pulcherrima]|uniref:Uncharacterized protein n=1 Tax=Metschnikowia aff. pulcherrima TaxID=2163413 RepID=A0A4P6XRA5_9ASCO|nr:hypothetical protein METSCH_D06770 [Metschnikowia aff. pulcherrima]
MATNPNLATNIALHDSLAENQGKYEDLRKHQKTVTSLPRTLRTNKRNKYVVVNHKSRSTKYKTGHVPARPASLMLLAISLSVAALSPKRIRLRRVQKARVTSLSERTFRKDSNARFARSRMFPGLLAGILRGSSGQGFRKNMTERMLRTTDMWLPSLKNTRLTHMERPFLRPLNAIEQLLNDEIVEPTATYFNGVRAYVNAKIESSFPGKTPGPFIYKSTQIIELTEGAEGTEETTGQAAIEGTSRQHEASNDAGKDGGRQSTESNQEKNKNNGNDKSKNTTTSGNTGSPRKPTNTTNKPLSGPETVSDPRENKERFFVFGRISLLGMFAKQFARRLRLDRLMGHLASDDGDDFVTTAFTTNEVLEIDAWRQLRKNRPPYIVMSACLSFLFGPPIKPYSPAGSGPQMVMSPVLSMSYNHLLLSPGKEIYTSETIDITDLRTERMKRVMRVRFAVNGANKSSPSSPRGVTHVAVRGTYIVEASPVIALAKSPLSCVLRNDPEYQAYILPLSPSHSFHTPVETPVIEVAPRSADTFTEFGYQVINSGEILDS